MHLFARALRKSPSGLLLAAAAIALIAASSLGAPAVAAAPEASACIPSGTDANINAALVGAGAQAVLCPGAVFSLSNSVTFTAANQQILTQGLPTDGTRAILRVTGSSLTTAINGNNQPGATVQNVQVDGNRPGLGALTGGALLEMGGAGTGQTVQNIYAHDTRSWSDLHIIEGAVTNSVPQCQNAKILDNTIGPSGTATASAPGNGTWADGISLACGNSLVQGNTVQDATDGGIVVFGAPGSTIQDNTIIAKSQLLFGGINMVDYAPMNGNYTGTLVTHNTIDAQGAYIKIGIAMGQQVWNCLTGTDYGGTVTDNTLEGQYMGYGYAVNGVSNWTVTGNADQSRHVGTQTAGGCFGSPAASQPGAFQVESATSSTLQPEFTSAVLTNILGTVNSPPINSSAPTLSASPSSLAFAGQNVGTTSAAQSVTVTNSGSASAAVSSITASGDFAQTNTCGSSLSAGASCAVNVTFTPTASGTRGGSITVAGNASNSPLTISLSGTGNSTPTTNLALGATMTAGGSQSGFPPSNANDDNTGSYWESANNAFPQWLQADLHAAQSLGSITLTLPPSSSWGSRTQTLSVLGSADGSTFGTLVASAGYTFNPATGNTVTIPLPASTSERYLRLNFTGNTGWPAGQVSEFQIYPGSGGGNQNPNLALNQPTGASSTNQDFVPGNAVDGNASSYWESTNNAFPQWLQVDLGSARSVGRVVLCLPPSTSWPARTQTLSVLGSTDGSTFGTVAGSAAYTFDPNNGNNCATIAFAPTTARYLRVDITANSGWPAGQISELQVYGS